MEHIRTKAFKRKETIQQTRQVMIDHDDLVRSANTRSRRHLVPFLTVFIIAPNIVPGPRRKSFYSLLMPLKVGRFYIGGVCNDHKMKN